jgi:hypothetical protein
MFVFVRKLIILGAAYTKFQLRIAFSPYHTEHRKVSEQEYSELKEALELKLLEEKEKVKKGLNSRHKDASIGTGDIGDHGTMPGGGGPTMGGHR